MKKYSREMKGLKCNWKLTLKYLLRNLSTRKFKESLSLTALKLSFLFSLPETKASKFGEESRIPQIET